MHSTINYLLFEIVYGFNVLTPMNLLALPERTSLDGKTKAKMVNKLHQNVCQHIKRKNEEYATKANKWV